MTNTFRTLAAGAIALACAAAFAQPGHGHDRRGPGGPHARRPGGPPHMQGPGPGMHRPGPPRHHRGPHAGPPPMAYPEYRRFNRGERLPPQYRRPQYVVQDWRGHGLRQPPRGYYWVQNGSDYVLAAIATGVISAVVINAMTR